MPETTKVPYKIYLEESEMPSSWYNLRADMINKPAPLLNPGTLEPMKAEELAPVFDYGCNKVLSFKFREQYKITDEMLDKLGVEYPKFSMK